MIHKLPTAGPDGLGAPTIMDRALAAEYGSPYVQLAVFAIDVDRVYALDPEADDLPFGWEVALTEQRLLELIEPLGRERVLPLLEETCMTILDQAPDEQGLGSQLVFAVYDAVTRGAVPAELERVFRSWRKPPKQLLAALRQFFSPDGADALRRAAAHCLAVEISPALAPPTLAALRDLARTNGPAAPSTDPDATSA